MAKRVGKREMKALFKKHNLSLGFPVDAEDGSIITDWSYHWHYKTYDESDLKKFEEIIKNEYADKYEFWNPVVMHSRGIKYKEVI